MYSKFFNVQSSMFNEIMFNEKTFNPQSSLEKTFFPSK